MAISCIILFITGLGMMFHSLNFIGTMMGGLKSLKFVHNWTALVFGFSLIFAISMWWKEAGVIEMPEDLEWIKCAGGYLWHVEHPPESGKYNPGQKMFFIAVALCGPMMVVTGLLMMFQILPDGADALDVHAARRGVCHPLCLLLRPPLPRDDRQPRLASRP